MGPRFLRNLRKVLSLIMSRFTLEPLSKDNFDSSFEFDRKEDQLPSVRQPYWILDQGFWRLLGPARNQTTTDRFALSRTKWDCRKKNRTLVETARCLLLHSNLLPHIWAEAVHTANYLRNRSPSRVLDGKIAFKLWTGKCPSVKNFRTFEW